MEIYKRGLLLFLISLVFVLRPELISAQTERFSITIDLKISDGKFNPLWNYFGYDEANFTTMKDGKKLLAELAEINHEPVYVRVHNLLTSGDAIADLKWSSTNAYTEDAHGNAIYNWTIVDSIFDEFTSLGIKPIVEIGFMPEALSEKPLPYRHHWKPGIPYDSIYTGWAYPPTNYNKWSELVYHWVKHCMARYGEDEIITWYWEVWNEPNIGYWKGTPEEYFTLYDYTSDAVKRACPLARIGGPTSTGPRWKKAADFLNDFLIHCTNGKNYATGKTGSPLDYITFHAKGDPKFVHEHVVMDLSAQLQDVAKAFEIINSFPLLKGLPVIIGEFDPEGCAACSVQFSPQNAYRNGTMYSSYTAASFSILYDLAKKYKIHLQGAVSWSFEFENQPWFAGFRDLSTHGVDKPVLNIFRMFGMMKGNMLEVQSAKALSTQMIMDSSVRGEMPFVHALATAEMRRSSIMLWNYHDDENWDKDAIVELRLLNIQNKNASIRRFTVDESHSNAYTVWKSMGSPQQVSKTQFNELYNAGKLKMNPQQEQVMVKKGEIKYSLRMQPKSVVLLQVSW